MFNFPNIQLKSSNLSQFHNTKVCLLGGTGFIGSWLVNAFNQLNHVHGFNVEFTVYTRDLDRALKVFPKQTYNKLEVRKYDFSDGPCDLGLFDFFVSGATPTSTKPSENSKGIFYTPTINAILSIIESAEKHRNNPRVVNLSSGSVYGEQSINMAHRPEGRAKDLHVTDDDYRKSKIDSERLLSMADVQKVLRSSSPRLFTFYGPGLHLDKHFAIGNFLRDGLNNSPIRIEGSPETRRSYMFPTDLVAWLLESILNPRIENFNIGSEASISMLDLANLISDLTGKRGVEIINPCTPPNNYVPSTQEFRRVYSVREMVNLEEGLDIWIKMLRSD